MNNKNNLHNNPHRELPPQEAQRIYQQRQLEEQRQLAERQQQYIAQQRQYDEEQRKYEEQQRQLEEHQRQLQQQQRQLEERRRQQEQHAIASVYPKLPSQEELPSYSAASSPIMNMPQPPQQYTSSPQIQYSQYPVLQPQPQLQPPPGPPTVFYGSIAPPNTSIPVAPQQENQIVQPVGSLGTKSELVQCPHCQQFVYTVLDYDSGLCTGLSVGGLFLVGCHSGGCLIPFLFPWTKDVSHHCPACKEKIATFTRLERDTRVTGPPLGL
jgi:hypothetical protein